MQGVVVSDKDVAEGKQEGTQWGRGEKIETVRRFDES